MGTRQRRSLRNVTLTKKYHMPYMGTSIFMSICLLSTLYGLFLYRFLEMYRVDPEYNIQAAVIIATLVTMVVGLLIIGSNVLAAHRIAGVHIKLRQMFEKVEKGDYSTRVRFRSDDKLDEVENAFNNMMSRIQERAAAAKDEKPEPTEEE